MASEGGKKERSKILLTGSLACWYPIKKHHSVHLIVRYCNDIIRNISQCFHSCTKGQDLGPNPWGITCPYKYKTSALFTVPPLRSAVHDSLTTASCCWHSRHSAEHWWSPSWAGQSYGGVPSPPNGHICPGDLLDNPAMLQPIQRLLRHPQPVNVKTASIEIMANKCQRL